MIIKNAATVDLGTKHDRSDQKLLAYLSVEGVFGLFPSPIRLANWLKNLAQCFQQIITDKNENSFILDHVFSLLAPAACVRFHSYESFF